MAEKGLKSYYISSYLSPKKVHKYFPWTKNFLSEKNIIDVRKNQLPSSLPTHVSFMYVEEPVFLKFMYNEVESSKKRPVTIVIDTLEGLKRALDVSLNNTKLEESLLSICESMKSNVIFVSEKDENLELGYWVDGIITLTYNIIDRKIRRRMYIKKLRGTDIKHPVFSFTLEDGRFKPLL